MNNYPKNAWALCWLMFFATALSFLDRQVLSVLAPSLMKELRMDNTDYSRVVSAFTFSYMIMFTAGGWLVDKLGTRWGLALCIAVWSAASGAHGFAMSALGLGVARLFLGFGEGGCFPASTKGACEWFPPAKRALAIGIANGGSAFGAVVAPPLTAWMALWFGWRGVFFTTGLLGFAWVLAWWITTSGRDSVSLQRTSGPKTATHQVPWRQLLSDARVWRILAGRFFFDPVFYFYMFWIPKYLSDERGFSLKEIGNYTWIPFLALGISNIASGQLSDLLVRRGWSPRKTRTWLLVIAALVTPVSGLVIVTPSAAWAIGLMAVLMAAHGLWICNFLAHISDQFPSSVIATVVGLSGTVGGIAATIANLGTGPVVDAFGFAPIFIFTAVLYPLAALILLAGRRPEQKANSCADASAC
ncbi:MAG: MFS transporter [Verrucomicrobia bacterium]|nr:MFS transporter [Verrucomicrobiota bacterium]